MTATQQPLVRRSSQVVADAVRAMILHGDLRATVEPLQEEDLAARLGVSRHHLREALRLLEQDGLVKVRPGRNGGIFVTTPGPDILTRAFSDVLAYQAIPLRDLLDARLAIEPAAAAIAAREATDTDFTTLDTLLAEQHQTPRYVEDLNMRFHVAVVSATHNQTLLLMMHAVEGIMRNVHTASDNKELVEGSYRAHRAIVRAMRNRDADRAAEVMRGHIAGYEQMLRALGVEPQTHTIADVLRAVAERRRSRTEGTP